MMRDRVGSVGELRDRVVIQQKTETPNNQGGRTVNWSTLATVWAAVRAIASPDESLRTGAVTASLRYDVEIRYRADVTPQMRLSWTPYLAGAAKTLEILGVTSIGRARLLLACAETA